MKNTNLLVILVIIKLVAACSPSSQQNTGQLIDEQSSSAVIISADEVGDVEEVEQPSTATNETEQNDPQNEVMHLPVPEGTDYVDVSTLDWVELPSQYIGQISAVLDTMTSHSIALVAQSDSSRYAIRAYAPRKHYDLQWEQYIDQEDNTIIGVDCLSMGMTTLRLNSIGAPFEGFDLRILCNGGNSIPQFAFMEDGNRVPFLYYRHVSLSDGNLRGASINPYDRYITLTAGATADYGCNAHVASVDGSERIDLEASLALGSLCHVSLSYDVLDFINSNDLVITLQNGVGPSGIFGTMTLERIAQHL